MFPKPAIEALRGSARPGRGHASDAKRILHKDIARLTGTPLQTIYVLLKKSARWKLEVVGKSCAALLGSNFRPQHCGKGISSCKPRSFKLMLKLQRNKKFIRLETKLNWGGPQCKSRTFCYVLRTMEKEQNTFRAYCFEAGFHSLQALEACLKPGNVKF